MEQLDKKEWINPEAVELDVDFLGIMPLFDCTYRVCNKYYNAPYNSAHDCVTGSSLTQANS